MPERAGIISRRGYVKTSRAVLCHVGEIQHNPCITTTTGVVVEYRATDVKWADDGVVPGGDGNGVKTAVECKSVPVMNYIRPCHARRKGLYRLIGLASRGL